jgi:hypothetical protein
MSEKIFSVAELDFNDFYWVRILRPTIVTRYHPSGAYVTRETPVGDGTGGLYLGTTEKGEVIIYCSFPNDREWQWCFNPDDVQFIQL